MPEIHDAVQHEPFQIAPVVTGAAFLAVVTGRFVVKVLLFIAFVICLVAALGGSIALGGAIGTGLSFVAAQDT